MSPPKFLFKNFRRVRYQRSFTLLESIVAIYVFLMGIVGVLTLANQSLSSSAVFRDQLVGANLAQEGQELVRSVRDTDFLTSWHGGCVGACDANTAFVPVLCNTSAGCRFDNPFAPQLNSATAFIPCDPTAGAPCQYLQKDPTTGFYQYNSGPSTKFDRRIIITPSTSRAGGVSDWRVDVTVSWQRRFGTANYRLVTQLTPWLQ